VADAFDRSVDDIEELWHGVAPPYAALFDWLEHRAERPSLASTPIFRPLMLAHALEESDWQAMRLGEFAAEWKWDGIRIQVAAKGGTTRLFSRTGDDIGQSFPELVDHFKFDAVLDGELLVMRNGEVAPFSDLQQRLNRKAVTRAMLAKYPVHVRFYDALEIGGEDLRALPFTARRERLEAWHREHGPAHSDLSEVLSFTSKEELKARWEVTRAQGGAHGRAVIAREGVAHGGRAVQRDHPHVAQDHPEGQRAAHRDAPAVSQLRDEVVVARGPG
jgi:DNA ligase-1